MPKNYNRSEPIKKKEDTRYSTMLANSFITDNNQDTNEADLKQSQNNNLKM